MDANRATEQSYQRIALAVGQSPETVPSLLASSRSPASCAMPNPSSLSTRTIDWLAPGLRVLTRRNTVSSLSSFSGVASMSHERISSIIADQEAPLCSDRPLAFADNVPPRMQAAHSSRKFPARTPRPIGGIMASSTSSRRQPRLFCASPFRCGLLHRDSTAAFLDLKAVTAMRLGITAVCRKDIVLS